MHLPSPNQSTETIGKRWGQAKGPPSDFAIVTAKTSVASVGGRSADDEETQ